MITEIVKELDQAKAKLVELEMKAAKQSSAALTSLPGEYGFSNLDEFIKAVRDAVESRRGRKPKKKAGKSVSSSPKSGKRAKITAEIKEQVKTLVAKGETGATIAKSLGISLPSVQNIKKELGLVKSRSK